MVVRLAERSDAAAFAHFLREAWQESGPDAPGFAGATDEVIDQITHLEAVEERIEADGRTMHLALEDGAVIGFAATRRIDEGAIELAGIIIRRAHAGRGVGTSLITASIEAASDQGFTTMIVRTEADNDLARAFYGKLGFGNPVPAEEFVDGEAIEVVEMARPLR